MSKTRLLQRACDYAHRKAAENNSDRDIIYPAKWFLDRYNELFHTGRPKFTVEYVSLDDADKSARYLSQGRAETTGYGETVMCFDGQCFIGSCNSWLEKTEKEYCKFENKIRCSACNEFSEFHHIIGAGDDAERAQLYRKEHTECTYCEDYFVNGDKIPEKGSQLTGCTELEDGDYGMLWIDNEQIPTDKTKSRHTSMLIRLQYTEQYDSEWATANGKYHVQLLAVTPGIVGKKARESLLETIGQTQEDWDGWDHNARCAICVDTGAHATLWQNTGNYSNSLLCEVEKERQKMHIFIGFKLDGPQNVIGSTGWDLMSGDILGGLKS